MTRRDPLTPADSDLSDFAWMPLDVGRFRRSDLATQEDADVIVAALMLWGAAWHSQPAASLSNDDRSLAQAAGFGRGVDAFLAIKKAALRGFVECSDGRLYHPVVAEKAVEAWEAKLKRLWRTECARIRKANERASKKGETEEADCPSFDLWRAARYAASHATAEHVTRDKPPMSHATKGDSHTRQDATPPANPDPTGDPARVKVNPSAAEDEQNSMSHATTVNVTRDKGLDSCARAEKGQGQGQGDSIDGDYHHHHSGDEKVELAEEVKAEPAKLDLIGKVETLGEKAGLNLTVPSKLIAATEQLKEWEEGGIDFAATIVPTIEARTRESPSVPIHSLRYFDAAVRKAHALSKDAKAPAPAKPAKPRPPIELEDSDDERVGRFRARLKYAVGEKAYSARYGPEHVATDIVDGRFLRVRFRSSSELALVTTGPHRADFIAVAESLGLSFKGEALR